MPCCVIARPRFIRTPEPAIGFKVPHWPDILEMSRRVSKAVGMGYIGADIVLDKARGPLLLEANARPGLAIQISNARGLLPELQRVDDLRGHKGAPH